MVELWMSANISRLFYVVSWDLNIGHHACKLGALLIVLPHQLCSFLVYETFQRGAVPRSELKKGMSEARV